MIAAKVAGDTPFVFASYADPVARGIRDSLQFSRRNNTGVFLRGAVDGKRLEILKDAFPGIRSVAILADRSWAGDGGGLARVAPAAAALGLRVGLVPADDLMELDRRLSSAASLGYDAWYVPPSYISYAAERPIVERLRQLRLPAMHATVAEVRAGALMAYEEDTSFAMASLADLVARVCRGERAGGIPVARPQRYVLAVRASTASSAPVIAATVVRRADVVIREP